MLRYWMLYIPYSLTDLLCSTSFSPHPLVSFSTFTDRIPNPRELRFTVLAKSIMYQILSALAYLHDPARSIAHRDIKPNNILLTAEGCVKLIDFGVAWKHGEDLATRKGELWPEFSEKMYFEVSTGYILLLYSEVFAQCFPPSKTVPSPRAFVRPTYLRRTRR